MARYYIKYETMKNILSTQRRLQLRSMVKFVNNFLHLLFSLTTNYHSVWTADFCERVWWYKICIRGKSCSQYPQQTPEHKISCKRESNNHIRQDLSPNTGKYCGWFFSYRLYMLLRNFRLFSGVFLSMTPSLLQCITERRTRSINQLYAYFDVRISWSNEGILQLLIIKIQAFPSAWPITRTVSVLTVHYDYLDVSFQRRGRTLAIY